MIPNRRSLVNRTKAITIPTLCCLVFSATPQIFAAQKPGMVKKKEPLAEKKTTKQTPEQHTIQCPVAGLKTGSACKPFYIFPRSVRTIIMNQIEPGKKYLCYFRGYHTWEKQNSKGKISRSEGLVGISLNNLKSEKGSDLIINLKKDKTLSQPMEIDSSSSKQASFLSFDIRNHTQNTGNYINIGCHEVYSFPQ